jgi:hypothetical protein
MDHEYKYKTLKLKENVSYFIINFKRVKIVVQIMVDICETPAEK